jgi:hypothetical protein
MGAKPTKQTKSRKQILTMKKENDQSRTIFSLQPYHPEHANLVCSQKLSRVEPGQYLDGSQIFRGDYLEIVLRQRGHAIKVQMESLMADLSKITKAKRIEEMVLTHVWLSGIKALPDSNLYF